MRKLFPVIILFVQLVSNAQNNSLLENRFKLAQTFERSHKYEQAIDIYKDILKAQPWNYKYLASLNNAYISIKNYDSSIALLSQRIKQNRKDINLYALLGKTYYTMGDYKKAFETWENALNDAGNSPVNYRIITNAAIEMRAFDKAIDIIKAAKNKYPESEMFLFDLSNLYTVTMKYKEAVEEYCKLLLTHQQHFALVRTRISQILNNHGAAETAIKVIKEYYENTKDKNYLSLLAFVYIQKNDFEKAFDINKKLESDYEGNGSRMYGFAQTAYRENLIDIASKAFEFILNEFPNSPVIPNAKLGYTKTSEKKFELSALNNSESWKPLVIDIKYNSNGFENVIRAYKELLNYYTDPQSVSEIYFRIGFIYKNYLENYDSSIVYFVKSFKKFPFSSFAYNSKFELGRQFMQNGRLKKAAEEFDGIIKEPRAEKKLKSSAQYNRSRIDFWNGRFESALDGLSEISNDLSDDNANDALQLSLLITALKTDSLTLLEFAKADMALFTKDYNAAFTIYDSLGNNENLLIWNGFAKYKSAEILLAQHKIAEAESVLKILINDKKPSLVKDKSLFLLGEIYRFGLKDDKKAVEQFRILLEKFPNSLYLDKARDFINSIQS